MGEFANELFINNKRVVHVCRNKGSGFEAEVNARMYTSQVAKNR